MCIRDRAKVIEYADKIDTSSQHLLGIINDVLDMSKIEAGKTIFKYTDFSILDFMEELNTIFHSQIDEKNQTLTSVSYTHLVGSTIGCNQKFCIVKIWCTDRCKFNLYRPVLKF